MLRRMDLAVYALTAILLVITASLWWVGMRPVGRVEPEAVAMARPNGPDGPDVNEQSGTHGSATDQTGSAQERIIVVHIAGAVKTPGVYHIKEGQRLYQALELAEPLEDADLDALNLAGILRDSEKVYVPKKGQVGSGNTDGGSGTRPQELRFPIDINSATAQELDLLPGIGPVLADAIVRYRTDNGPFRRPEDIKNVPGIGEKTYQKFAGLIVAR